jgi:hypothetical protein
VSQGITGVPLQMGFRGDQVEAISSLQISMRWDRGSLLRLSDDVDLGCVCRAGLASIQFLTVFLR